LCQDTVQHASQVSQMLRSLGTNPEDGLLSSVREPEPGDIVPILKNKLVAENEAARLYKEANDIADEYAMRNWLQQQVNEERQQAALVKQVLEKLET
jgi:bacterioferritin (cytochrome b1)